MHKILNLIFALLVLIILCTAPLSVHASPILYRTGNTFTVNPYAIDPTLSWNTFLGGAGNEEGYDIAVDSSGNIYFAGWATATWGSPVRDYAGGSYDVVVVKLNSSGVLQWNTFLGGAGADQAYGIAVDPDGNVYVSGMSAEWGSPVRAYTAGYDGFVAKLNSSGVLQWNTFLGAAGTDYARSITADAAGNVYVCGWSPNTWGSPVRAHDFIASGDGFAARLDGSSGALVWNTFLGGAGEDSGYGIALDSGGNVYVTGDSPQTWGSPVRAYTAMADAYIAKLKSINGALVWNTFLGGSANERSRKIAIDRGDNIYITGYSNGTWGSPVRAYTSNLDATVARVNSGTGILEWNTFLGGSTDDRCDGIAIDSGGNVYVAGNSSAAWGTPVNAYSGARDVLVCKLGSGGDLAWHTFLGSAGNDWADDIAADSNWNLYITGKSVATWGSPVRAYTAGDDAIAVKIAQPAPAINSFTPTSGGKKTQVIITGTNLDGATSVWFGGTSAESFTVNSSTRITAIVATGTTGIISVRAPTGTAVSTAKFTFGVTDSFISTGPRGSSVSAGTAAPPQSPVSLPTVSVRCASLSAAQVAPGAPVTVTADVVNTGTVNGSDNIKVYVNGELENSQGITVNSGSSTPVTFNVSRNEPGTYTVYVGGTSAGSFTVDQFSDPNTVLYISGALLVFAFMIGILFILRRKQAQ